MNASKTKIFPETVKIIQIPKLIAIKIVCHKTKGGRTGLIVATSPSSRLPFTVEFAEVVKMSRTEDEEVFPKRFRGSSSFTSRELVFKAWVHSVKERKPL